MSSCLVAVQGKHKIVFVPSIRNPQPSMIWSLHLLHCILLLAIKFRFGMDRQNGLHAEISCFRWSSRELWSASSPPHLALDLPGRPRPMHRGLLSSPTSKLPLCAMENLDRSFFCPAPRTFHDLCILHWLSLVLQTQAGTIFIDGGKSSALKIC